MSIEFQDCGAIAKALAAAQNEMRNPAFDAANPHYRSNFASLAAVRNAVVPILAKHGIAVLQDLQTVEKGVACYTILLHESGQRLTLGPLVIPAAKPDAQGLAAAGTYAKRLALQASVCVVGDDDDDGNAASGKPAPALAPNAGKGIGVHSPLGDTVVDDAAIQFSDAFKEALAESPEAVYAVHCDLHDAGEEAYRNAWALLDSKSRSAIKKILDGRKAA